MIPLGDTIDINVVASSKNYVLDYVGQPNRFELDQVPAIDGSHMARLNPDIDRTYGPNDVLSQLTPDHHLMLERRTLRQDPVEGPVKLHPIEVVIDDTVVEAMRQQALEVCEGKSQNRKETGGFLGGRLCQDGQGRCWVHIQLSAHAPSLVGTEVELDYSPEIQNSWTQTIKRAELQVVGFWHSHPTYQPFQSDARTWGADVQTTYNLCKGWWDIALVIDPFAGKQEADQTCMVGAYRIVSPNSAGPNIDQGFSPGQIEPMGWRSVSFAVNSTAKRGNEE